MNKAGDTAQIAVYPEPPRRSRPRPPTSCTRCATTSSRRRSRAPPPHAYVGGETATNEDVASKIIGSFPLFLLFVVGVIFL